MTVEEIREMLYNEVLVDCKDEGEQKMSWFYYAQDELEFPFDAEIKLKRANGKVEKKKVEILRLATDDSNFDRGFDLKVELELEGYIIEVSLSKLNNIEDLGKNDQIVEAWKYWVTH